ncbi:MAG: AraC family transcriptional regulator [Burkholderiales bacterium]|nr:MAG: AraC family transcriptional regulator [Burkholderiales bacterium]
MPSEPRIEQRPEQLYVGIGAVMPLDAFERDIPAMTERVLGWLKTRGLKPSGRPFLRYNVIDMPERLDVELGVPVEVAAEGDGGVKAGVLPAGRYAVMTYQGAKNGVAANKALFKWIEAQNVEAVSHKSADGEVFAARYETFLNDVEDQGALETEVAMKLRE